jgi:hypothetical protein
VIQVRFIRSASRVVQDFEISESYRRVLCCIFCPPLWCDVDMAKVEAWFADDILSWPPHHVPSLSSTVTFFPQQPQLVTPTLDSRNLLQRYVAPLVLMRLGGRLTDSFSPRIACSSVEGFISVFLLLPPLPILNFVHHKLCPKVLNYLPIRCRPPSRVQTTPVNSPVRPRKPSSDQKYILNFNGQERNQCTLMTPTY